MNSPSPGSAETVFHLPTRNRALLKLITVACLLLLGLFVALAATMCATRNLDWYSRDS